MRAPPSVGGQREFDGGNDQSVYAGGRPGEPTMFARIGMMQGPASNFATFRHWRRTAERLKIN
jgi:hypothetical protein